MAQSSMPEVWLRGPLPDLSPFLQPVAHALLQAREEVLQLVKEFPADLLWERPAGVAAVGFHLQHLTGVLDRLLTYADGKPLSEEQMAYLKQEGRPGPGAGTLDELVTNFENKIEETIQQLKAIDPHTLTDFRAVGRAGLPSTVMGLLFHAAEHTMRHTGQLLVTVKVLLENKKALSE